MKKQILLVLISISFTTHSQNLQTFLEDANTFFSTYVSNGKVNYSQIKKDSKSLNNLMNLAAEITISKSEKNKYKAFWINAYNLSVIKGIVSNYPVKSPLDISGFFDKDTYKLGGKKNHPWLFRKRYFKGTI